jgi:TonB family protein
MRKIFSLTFWLTIIIFASTISHAQTNDWVRVISDDGEFSIEVPAKHNFFYDKQGFLSAKGGENTRVENMNMLNAFHDGTLVSFETYQSKKGALDTFYEHDKRISKNVTVDFSEIKNNGTTIKQIVTKTDKYYCLRQFFHSKSNIYILTAASENGVNATIKRFLDSLVFRADKKDNSSNNSILFSSLKVTPVNVVQATLNNVSTTDSSADRNLDSLLIVKRAIPIYTEAARVKGVQGTVLLRATFSEDGFIPKIEVVKSLPHGLLRQAIFTMLRLKFLPQKKDGKYETVTKVLEYNFLMY